MSLYKTGLLILTCLFSNQALSVKLNVFTWPDYIDPDIVSEFTAATGIELSFTYYEQDTDRDHAMLNGAHRTSDLILVAGNQLPLYARQNWVRQVNLDDIENSTHLDDRWVRNKVANRVFGIPYFWGTMGIAYRTDLLSKPINSWQDIFTANPELINQIIAIGSVRELMGAALLSMNKSVNTQDADTLSAAELLLFRQQENVHMYGYTGLDETAAIVRGDVSAVIAYNGDGVFLSKLNPKIKYITPAEGTIYWVDYWAVSSGAQHPEEAMAFINFINQPTIAARLADYLGYASPNLAAQEFLPAEHLSDTNIYPKISKIDPDSFIEPLPANTIKRYNEIVFSVTRKADQK